MFGFLSDYGNYEARKVGRDDFDWGFISTAYCSDGSKPYETAVCHEQYRKDGNMVIVESYDTKAAAEKGHKKWVNKMTAKTLPPKLVDCANAGIAGLCEAIGGKMEYPLLSAKKKTSRRKKARATA